MTTLDPVHFERLIELLQKRPLQMNRERKNSGVGRSIAFGIIYRRNLGLGRARYNKIYPEVYSEILKITKLINPDVNYTSFQLNDNYRSSPHVDANNDGTSCIIGFGDYTGGEINVDGKKYNIRYTPLHMDASIQLHYTEPWEGCRYSLVIFRGKLKKPCKGKYDDWTFTQMNDALGDYTDSDTLHKLE